MRREVKDRKGEVAGISEKSIVEKRWFIRKGIRKKSVLEKGFVKKMRKNNLLGKWIQKPTITSTSVIRLKAVLYSQATLHIFHSLD